MNEQQYAAYLAEKTPLWAEDYPLYARDCLVIVDKDANQIPFVFNRPQKYFWKLEQQCLETGKSFRLIVLKSRQFGSSTYFAYRLFWKARFNPYVKSLILTHHDEITSHIFSMQKFALKNLPAGTNPAVKFDNRDTLEFEVIGSRVSVGTAKNKHVGAGTTQQHVHMAEVGRYDEVTDFKVMYASLRQAVPNRIGTSIVAESTAHGEGSFKKLWDQAVEGLNDFTPCFISYVPIEEYRKTDYEPFELSDRDDHLYGNEEEEAALIEKEIRFWYPELDDGMAESEFAISCMKMDILAWRREAIVNNCQGDKKVFDQEYPITPDRAFNLSGDAIFDQEKLAITLESLRKRPPKCTTFVFDVKASDDKLTNKEWWKLDNAFEENRFGTVHIYEPPIPTADYVMGVDTAEGLSHGDESAIVILRTPEPLVEVAHFCKQIDPDYLSDLAYALAWIYNQALIGVERNTYGVDVIGRLTRELKYRRMYWKNPDTSRVPRKEAMIEYGWKQHIKTKPILHNKLREYIRDDLLQFNSYENAKEHKSYKKVGENDYKTFDDEGNKKSANRVIATGIAACISSEIYRFPKVQTRQIEKYSLKWFEQNMAQYIADQPKRRINTW